MKKTITFLLLIIGGWQMNAQPVINHQFFPRIGHNQERVDVFPFNISPGDPDPDQNWDFSHLQPSIGGVRTTYEHHSPGLTPYGDAFPQANVAAVITDTVEIFAYYHISPASWDWLGVGTEFGPQVYDDPLTILKPLAFHESFRDTASLVYTFENFAYTQYIEATTWYRAYGTLKLPQGTFHDAVLLETDQVEIDSFHFGDEGFYSIDTIYTKIWNWMIIGGPGPLGTYSISEGVSKFVIEGEAPQFTTFGPEPDAQFDLSIPTATQEPGEQLLSRLSISPNPASETTWLDFTASQQLKQASLRILDGSGRTIHSKTVDLQQGANNIPIEIDGLPGGLYWVNLTTHKQTQTVKLLVR